MLSEFKGEWKHSAKQYPEQTKKKIHIKEKKIINNKKKSKGKKIPFMGISSEVYWNKRPSSGAIAKSVNQNEDLSTSWKKSSPLEK